MSRGFRDEEEFNSRFAGTSSAVGEEKSGDELMEFNGNLHTSSLKAYKFQADQWDKAEWIPKSQSEMTEFDQETKACTMRIKRWLCEKNGWSEI